MPRKKEQVKIERAGKIIKPIDPLADIAPVRNGRKIAIPSHELRIPAPDFRIIGFDIKGTRPLLVHKWSEKAMREMAQAQARAVKTSKREKRDPEAEFRDSMYEISKGVYGFPAGSFRLACISACRAIDGLTMTQARLLFRVVSDRVDELVRIIGPAPTMDVRPVRLSNGSADIRYRGMFWPWATKLMIRYNARAVTAEQIGHLLLLAGESVGIGELRPEKGGNYGCFAF